MTEDWIRQLSINNRITRQHWIPPSAARLPNSSIVNRKSSIYSGCGMGDETSPPPEEPDDEPPPDDSRSGRGTGELSPSVERSRRGSRWRRSERARSGRERSERERVRS